MFRQPFERPAIQLGVPGQQLQDLPFPLADLCAILRLLQEALSRSSQAEALLDSGVDPGWQAGLQNFPQRSEVVVGHPAAECEESGGNQAGLVQHFQDGFQLGRLGEVGREAAAGLQYISGYPSVTEGHQHPLARFHRLGGLLRKIVEKVLCNRERQAHFHVHGSLINRFPRGWEGLKRDKRTNV